MIQYTHAEIRRFAQMWRIPEEKAEGMARAGVLDPKKINNSPGPEFPEGGIRFKDACEKYELPKSTLSEAVSRHTVLTLERRSWKYLILDEASVAAFAKTLGKSA